MAREFIDSYHMQGGGIVGLLRPALLDVGNSIIDAYAQEPCVFRFSKRSPSTIEAIKLTLAAPDGQTVETYISFDRSDTQYYDITEPLRCWIERGVQNSSIDTTDTRFVLRLTEYDANNDEISETGYAIRAYDASEPLDAKFEACLPDTFRLLADASLIGYETACARAIASACKVEILLADGTVQTDYTGLAGDIYTAGWRFLYHPTSTPAVVRVGVSPDYETARVDWINCSDNMAQMRWWSPSFGGYKSVAVELLSSVASLSGDAAYIRGFDNVFAASMAGGVKARIPLCTMRDVMYYRDIYISDEVEMVWSAGLYSYAKRIKIDGEVPEIAANGTADMEMTIRLSEVSTEW